MQKAQENTPPLAESETETPHRDTAERRGNHPKYLDNRPHRVVDELRTCLEKGSILSVVSAYFSIYAFDALKSELETLEAFRFIFTAPTFVPKAEDKDVRHYGIERRKNTPKPSTSAANQVASEDDPHQAHPDIVGSDTLAGTEFEIKLRNGMLRTAVARECAEWIRRKGATFKSFKKANSAQPRLLHLQHPQAPARALSISGTIDFTSDGLGITSSDRIDANTAVYGDQTAAFVHLFESLWSNTQAVEDVTETLLRELHTLYRENPPDFLYFLTLYRLFYRYLEELSDEEILKTKTGIKDTAIWQKLFKFQQDGAVGAIEKLEKHNGCIIADSVGLGKTFTALAVIKYYELRNDRVLVLCPKKLRENWNIYRQNDQRNILEKDRFRYDLLHHTDLSRQGGQSGDINLATLNWGNYDLVVIDESHNFRNDTLRKEEDTGQMPRYHRLFYDVVCAGVNTKVLMLSATPVNIALKDLANQLAILNAGKDDALEEIGIESISKLLQNAQEVYNEWSKLTEKRRTTEMFVEMMDASYFKLLDTYTIARSRKHIEKYYDIAELGPFPAKRKPLNYYPEIDIENQFFSIEDIIKKIRKLTFCRYMPQFYILPNYIDLYDIRATGAMVNLMRSNMLKRMESSIHAFRLTVERMYQKTLAALQLFGIAPEEIDKPEPKGKTSVHRRAAEGEELASALEEEELAELEEGELEEVTESHTPVKLKHIDRILYTEALKSDALKLRELIEAAKKVTPDRDAKLLRLKSVLSEKLTNPINEGNRKVIVFTAFADTAQYLYEHLQATVGGYGLHSAMVLGSNDNESSLTLPFAYRSSAKKSDPNNLLTLFSPKSKEADTLFPEIEDRIDLLIATDCVSEGQNLQDCDFLVNYDIHWNPVRIIQRFGRIDRIGSHNTQIQLVNFWPTEDLDEYINLRERVMERMVLLDVSATGEENLLEEQGESQEMKDLKYRKTQLLKLREEANVNLEDIAGGISITDLTYNDFKADLSQCIQQHGRTALDKAPTGLYACVAIPPEWREEVAPGVIFTLRQRKDDDILAEGNPFFPFYTVYVDFEGTVRLGQMQSKKILDLYKRLCKGQKEPDAALCAQFEQETRGGAHMAKYNQMLNACIAHIRGEKEQAGIKTIFSAEVSCLQKGEKECMEHYELVSFLILR